MAFWLKLFVLGLLSAVCVGVSHGQINDDEDVQSWNDLQIAVPLGEKVDLLLLGTVRFASNLSKLSEMRVGSGINWKATKTFSISPTYQYIETRNLAGQFRTEHRVSLRGNYKFPVKKIGLSHRSTFEYRVRSSGNSWRYRPSLTFDKALPDSFLKNAKIFVTEEPFYVSTTRKFSRNRFSVGLSKTLSQHLAVDIYYLRQNDGYSHPGDLNVIGTTWKYHF